MTLYGLLARDINCPPSGPFSEYPRPVEPRPRQDEEPHAAFPA